MRSLRIGRCEFMVRRPEHAPPRLHLMVIYHKGTHTGDHWWKKHRLGRLSFVRSGWVGSRPHIFDLYVR